MKTTLLISAAAVALFAAAPALAQSVGSVGVSYAESELDTPLGDVEGDAWTVDGQFAFNTANAWTVTIDGAVSHSDDADSTAVSGTAHATRMFDDVRAGGFAGLVDVEDETLWAVGGEAQKYMGDVTLAGQVAYGQADELDADLIGVRGEVRYFVNPNFRIDGGVGFTNVDVDGLGDDDAWSVGAGAEYQFAATPFSVFASYDRTSFDELDTDIDTLRVGFRYSFGGDLQTRDRAGASLGSVASAFAGALDL